MKHKVIISLIISLSFTGTIMAQQLEINKLTAAYYGITEALTKSDTKNAAIQANLFIESLEAVSKSDLSEKQLKSWQTQKGVLESTAKIISESTELESQRKQLNELSNTLFEILKRFKLNDGPVYYQYCPMKKAYWLSNEKEIKNPYYGQSMLTCGSVVEILN